MEFETEIDSMTSNHFCTASTEFGDYITVPIFRGYMSACAGSGIFDESGEPYETETYPSWIFGSPIGRDPDTVPFILEVSGGSMEEAGICDGDMVCINPLAYVGDNDIALVVLDGQKFTKAVFWHRDGGRRAALCVFLLPCQTFYRRRET